MFSEDNSMTGTHHQRIILSPIKRPKKKKILEQKQKKFVLDCTNQTKSKLEQYNYLKDKYLNYCVVKIPKKKRLVINAGSKSQQNLPQIIEAKNHINFKKFLQSKRDEIMSKAQQRSQVSCNILKEIKNDEKQEQDIVPNYESANKQNIEQSQVHSN